MLERLAQMIKFKDTRYKSGAWDMSLVLFGIIYFLVLSIYGKGVMVAGKRELELRWWFATVPVK